MNRSISRSYNGLEILNTIEGAFNRSIAVYSFAAQEEQKSKRVNISSKDFKNYLLYLSISIYFVLSELKGVMIHILYCFP